MKLFQKKQKRDRRQKQPPKREGMKFENQKRQLADYLGRQSEKLSGKNKKILLLVFGIVMGGMSLLLIIDPFRKSQTSASFLIPERIEPPAIEMPQSMDPLLNQEYEMLTGFLHTLDSLKECDPSKYNKVLKDREGLVHSIKFLLKFYD